ncbi:MAG: CHAD domain-containing protein [Planctomycetaceae bacterium]
MRSLQDTKWIEHLHPEGSVVDAAKKTLKLRLGAVRQLLRHRPSSETTESEAIHQVRVASRRAAAAIELYADLLPSRRVNWIDKRLKKLRKAAGPTRDLDVTAELFAKFAQGIDGATVLLSGMEQESRVARREFRDSYHGWRKDRKLQRRLKSLRKRVDAERAAAANARSETFSRWSRTELRRVVQEFFDAAPTPEADAEALHQFRIQCKSLRYTIELVGSAFPPELRNETYPALSQMQSMLGEINDLVMASRYLTRTLSTAQASLREQPLRALRDACDARHAAACDEFHLFWSGEIREQLSSCFEEMLADREETCDSLR